MGLSFTAAVEYDRPVSDLILVIVEGQDSGSEFPLAGTTLVGRGPDADVVVGDTEVSSRHASLVLVDGGVSLEDLGSTNGTFVNGQRVTGSQRAPGGGPDSAGRAR